jgi:hypothetical protein
LDPFLLPFQGLGLGLQPGSELWILSVDFPGTGIGTSARIGTLDPFLLPFQGLGSGLGLRKSQGQGHIRASTDYLRWDFLPDMSPRLPTCSTFSRSIWDLELQTHPTVKNPTVTNPTVKSPEDKAHKYHLEKTANREMP